MNSKKIKEKERRRARKLADQAWQAADEQNHDLAEKIIRRAVNTQPDNPVLWNDQGVLLALRSKEAEAEEAFRAALSLAPSYAEPYAHLAALRAKRGYLHEAIRLMEMAVQHAPQTAPYVERLAAYRALLVPEAERPKTLAPVPPTGIAASPTANLGAVAWLPKAAVDWSAIAESLTRDGCVLLSGLVDADTCANLRSLFEDDVLFAKTVVMDRDDFGKGTYRYFRAPIPATVDALRCAVYPHVAAVANEWQSLLNKSERFPAEWDGFREVCRDAGQTTPTPILLRYGPGGFNALHRDLRGAVYFPIQMAVVLSPMANASESSGEGFEGGEFLFCDVPEGKKSRRRLIPAGLGDALLFCTRDRLVRIGGAYGLLPVKHGVNVIMAGTRLVLGIPFHDYR